MKNSLNLFVFFAVFISGCKKDETPAIITAPTVHAVVGVITNNLYNNPKTPRPASDLVVLINQEFSKRVGFVGDNTNKGAASNLAAT